MFVMILSLILTKRVIRWEWTSSSRSTNFHTCQFWNVTNFVIVVVLPFDATDRDRPKNDEKEITSNGITSTILRLPFITSKLESL